MFRMKRGTVAALTSTTVAVLLAVTVVSCGAGESDGDEGKSETVSTVPAEINATNVTRVTVEGLNDQITVFDIERDGRILTCTTKDSFRAGVSCLPAVTQQPPAEDPATIEEPVPAPGEPTVEFSDGGTPPQG